MKKGLIFLIGLVSFFGINTVNAKEIYLEYDTNVNQVKPYIEQIGYDVLNNAISENIKYYNENLANDYPYYFISLQVLSYGFDSPYLHIKLSAFDNLNYNYYSNYFDQSLDSSYLLLHSSYTNYIAINYNLEDNTISEIENAGGISLFDLYSDYNYYNPYNYYYSNFDLYYRGSLFNSDNDDLTYLNPDDSLYIPFLDGSNKQHIYAADRDFLIEPYYLYDDNSSFKSDIYTSINLNDYSYVVLSLKDYNTIPDNNYSLYTNLNVKGQVCITPVYNYGQTERKDILTGTQVQGCSQYYNDFTLTRMYILKDDVKNHAIYYLKAYDTSKENYVKVDSSKFNITYITEEEKNNPQVNINGKIYPTLSYDSLTDTATKSQDEGYIPGVSCAIGDFNCHNEYNSSNIFNDLFDKPLEMLKSVWNAIISIFELVGEFILLLPPTMQGFLYISFAIAIILGIIKILL